MLEAGDNHRDEPDSGRACVTLLKNFVEFLIRCLRRQFLAPNREVPVVRRRAWEEHHDW